ncbi:MAG TPA: 50S ribosomal protein L3 [Candidatus Nanoarchaeia archaeon]|nr:50S ribosomal protein L3 [Candidatus Nanoarchaeia archaeon]
MPKPKRPRFGSMGVWHRRRANRPYARVRSWAKIPTANILGFAAYKAGMTHLIVTDTRKNSVTKGLEISIPATVLECPPIRILQVRFYHETYHGQNPATQLFFKAQPEVERKINLPKKFATVADLDKIKPEQYTHMHVVVCTQPKLIDFKKKPEIFELALGGKLADQIAFVKQHIDKDIAIKDVFQEGHLIDAHAVTKGKGYQGSIKRFGIGLKMHKTEKGIRRVGSLGGWSGQAHFLYRVAHPGQMGYHQRVQYNLQILKIGEKAEEVNPKGGWPHYGLVKSNYLILKGSIPGAKKRLILLTQPIRAKREQPLPTIEHISLQSKQGR